MENVIKSLEYMTIGSSLHDKNGNVIYINPVFCKIFKTENKRLNNKKLSEEFIDVNIESKFNVFDFINININNIDNLVIKITFNNKYRLIRINSIMIKNGVDYHILTYDDITDNMNHSYLYEEIFNNIKTGLIICKYHKDNFYIKDINPYFESLYNKKKDILLNKNINTLNLPTINNIPIYDIIHNVWKSGLKFEEGNTDCNNSDTKPCWRNIYIQKVTTGDIIIMFDDITEIIQSKRKVEDYNKQKTDFLSNMSHEIRSPINSIIGFADMLDFNSKNKKKQIEYINIIKNSGKMLTQLIDDILDTSKIEAGELSVNNDIFNVNKILDEVYLTTKSNNKKDNVEIKKNFPSKNINIVNDEFRFRQILNNLVTNSMKFTKKGYIEIGYKINSNSNNITFYVKDTGIGIREEDKSKVFERFQKLNKKSKIGSGLGLPISNELSKLMNGKLYFDSEYGEGSTFYIQLPIGKKQRNMKSTSNNINIDNLDLTGKKILIAEDVEFNTKLLISYLEETNAELILAVDGNDTLIKYNDNKNNLDLILMDIQMPNIEGTEVTQIIRTIDQNTPIIAQTAYAIREEVDDIMEYGFDDLIKKPIRKDDLLTIISKYIK
jgi:signal transduction histidine kinase/CheY-like chemotaxis protein